MKWVERWAGAIVVATVLVVYAPTLVFHRVAYDDYWLWSDHSPLRDPDAATWRTVWFELDAPARHDLGTEYLPVRDVLVALDMAVWGDNDCGPHATQLALFVLVVFGAGRLLVRYGVRREVAWLGVLLWAIHPMRVETVAWLSERKGVLAALFVVACGHAWLRCREGRSRGWLAAAAAAAVAATWSKAPAMFAPAAFAALDLLLLERARRRWLAIGVVGAATAAAALPVIAVAFAAGAVDGQYEPHVDGRLVAFVGSIGHYVAGGVLARPSSISYAMQTDGATALDLVLGATALAIAVGLAAWAVRAKHRGVLAVLAWLAILYVPVSHLATEVHIVVADRYVFLASLAPALGLAWCLLRLRGNLRTAVVALACVGLAVATVRAEEPWTSSEALYTRAVTTSPRDAKAREALATMRFSGGAQADGLALLDEGLALAPDHPYLWAAKAGFLHALRREDEAIAAAERASRSGNASTMALYAGFLADAGRVAEALPFAERAVQRRPEVAAYTWRWIDLLATAGQLDRALAEARAALPRFPIPGSHMVLARTLARSRDPVNRAEVDVHLAIASVFGASRDEIERIRRSAIDTAAPRGRD